MSFRLPSAFVGLLQWPVASLRTYLVAVMLVATVPLGALTSWLIAQEILSAREQLSQGLRRTASALALTVDRELASSVDALAILSHSDTLQGGDLPGFHLMLKRLPQVRPTWSRVLLADLQGRVLLSNDAPYGRPSDAAPIPLRPLQQVLRTERPAVTDLLSGGPKGVWLTQVQVPVVVNGQMRYVLAAQISARTWQSLIADVSVPGGGFLTLFDRGDRIIARNLHPQRFVGQRLPDSTRHDLMGKASGFQRYETTMEGGPTYAAWQRMGLSGWGVGVGVPAEPLDQAHTRAMSVTIGAGLLSLLAGVGLSLVVARRVSEPLGALAAGGPRAVPGKITVREIAQLRDALWTAEQQRELAREHLEAKAAEFEALFTTSPIGLSITQDPQGREVLRNPAKMAMFNLRPGHPAAIKVFHQGVELAEGRQPLQRAARGETVWNQELEVHHDDGRVVKLLAHAMPLLDAVGRPRGGIATFVDITERMQAQERLVQAERRLRESRHLVELAQEAGDVGFFDHVLATDTVTITSGLARLLGMGRREYVTDGAGWLACVDPEDAPLLEHHLQAAFHERQEQVTFKFRTRSQGLSPRWLSSRMVVMYDEASGQAARMIGVMVDVTAQQLVEQERARLIAHEHKARVEAENANRAKDEFLAMLGHELRNPLGAISAAVEVLNRTSVQDKAASRVRQIITRQTRHLARLMDDLLDVARVITGKISLSRQPLNLGAAVQRLVGTMTMAGGAQQHPLSVTVQDVWIQADAMRVEQIVNNLLTNAVKYSPVGQPITVTVDRDEAGQARLRVADQGMGIPEDLLPRIFDLFVQGERALDRRQGGLGIGLTLVKRLVELHEGRIEADSSPEGSTFTMVMPAIAPPVARHEVAVSAEAAPRRVVVVEDNEDAQEALRLVLELSGHQVWLEANGHDGLARVLQVQPDVALVDIGLPGLNGYQVARQARTAGFRGKMIALSGYGQQRDIQMALDSGFDAHMVKPVDMPLLERHLGLATA